MLAVASLAACQQSHSRQAQSPPSADRAAALRVGSKVADMHIVGTSRLPANSKRAPVEEYCSAYAIAKPKSPGGRLAARNGWIVTSETKLGNYDAVTFVGRFEPSTSATCAHVDGNLAVFDGPRLKALAYLPHPSGTIVTNGTGSDITDSLGVADQIDPRRIRLYYGLPSSPFADVVLRDGIFVEPTTKEDSVCGGAAKVPNVYGEDIRRARKTLRSYGWLPDRPPPEQMTGSEDLIQQGVIEMLYCSGTGYAFCGFNYKHRKGFRLSVATMGEDYGVTSYSIGCPGSGQSAER